MSAQTPSDPVTPRLEELRRKLLDLTRRNRLLNFRLARRSSIRVVDDAGEVYRVLVVDGKAMQLLAREESPVPLEVEVDPEDPFLPVQWTGDVVPLGVADRHRDTRLQTAMEGDRLQARLTYLARESRSSLEEQGCNTLYLALGMVQWQEAGAKAVVCEAPLVFVPVELRRKNVQSRYSVAAFDDDVLVNPCLAELCRRQFGVELPPLDQDEEIDDYFARFSAVLEQDLKGWKFVPEINLGLFSFAKYLMYRDLDPASWPAARPLERHVLVQKLCGLPVQLAGEVAQLPDPGEFDATIAPADSFQVVDADSSQTAAILAAKRGKTLVIEGPPGTGKSQTITNIIAECLASGRTVLFVAEKSAALEVVKRRLDRVGLGDFALEMHSRFSKRRAVLDELRRALAGSDRPAEAAGASAEELARLRNRLNTYVGDLHAPQGKLQVSAHGAITHAAELADAPEAACELPDPLQWSPEQLELAGEAVEGLDRALAQIGDASQHPWRGAKLETVGVEVRQRIASRARELLDALREYRDALTRLADVLKVAAPATLDEGRQLLQHAVWLAESPAVPMQVLQDERWERLGEPVLDWVEHGLAREEHRKVWSQWFAREAEQEFWGDVLDRRREQVDSWLRYVQPSWYADSRRIERSLKPGARPSPPDELKALTALRESTRLRAQIEADLPRYKDMLGAVWTGLDGDWKQVGLVVRTVREAHRLARESALDWPVIRAVLSSSERGSLVESSQRFEGMLHALNRRLAAWCEALGATPTEWLAAAPERLAPDALTARLEPLAAQLDRLDDWVAAHNALVRARSAQLASFTSWCLSPEGARNHGAFRRAFARQFWSIFADRALAARETLRSFRGEDHHALVERFRKADVEWIRVTRQRLVQRMRQRQPDLDRTTQRESRLGQLKAQMKLKRGGVSLRKLFEATGDVVQAIKPCFMMSPISVAQYLAPGAIQFDVVIFDEASQVEPADAFGAIARGNQLLLIGDDKQLPPTNFFGRSDGPADSDSVEVAAADQESILDVGRNALSGSSVCSLRWHYRSLHQSLITFSNEHFYDGKLRVFPSPHADRTELGLVMRHVPDGVYLRGEGQYNPTEARAVATAVIEHARRNPLISLGVGAFSTAQQRAIEDELERIRRHLADDQLETFFQPARPEPFFVKNLETIQGDERDVIFLSVGYGRDRDDHLTMNFGPLNREGGWRRLNVLITRARRRCEVFSSIRHDDIRVPSDPSRGVAALKEYLRVAEQGTVDALSTADVSTARPRLEVVIARALEQRGYTVHVHVGAAGFHIDVAIVDPDRPGRYLLGVECDGETYVSAATARDRDRLRVEVLVSLGWSVARIWAADWFRRPAILMDQLVATIEELRRAPRRETEPHVPTVEPLLLEEDDPDEQVTLTGASADGIAPYVSTPDRRLGSLDALLKQSAAVLISLITEIVTTEAPVHEEHVVKLIASWFDTKAAARARTHIRQAIAMGARAHRYDLRDQFLWRPGQTTAPPRFRGGDCPVTRPEHIALEEFAAAALQVLAREFGMPRSAMIPATLRLLGFRRTGARLVQAAEQAIDWLILNGHLQQASDGALKPASPR